MIESPNTSKGNMNERIRQLYYECQDESQSTEQCYQKFALLIIAECTDICDGYGMPDGTSPVAAILSEAIKNKFGV